MKNSFKKLTAWLCCMAMLISFIPATALPVFAAAEALPTSGTLTADEYVLSANATLTGGLTVSSGDVTVDLGGKTLTTLAGSAITVTGGKLTLKNGTVQGVASNATVALVTVQGGEFVLDGATLTGNKTKSTARLPGGIYATGGTVTINSGTVSGTNGASSTLLKRTGHSLYAENATVNITGGTINGGDYHVVLGENAELNLSGNPVVDTIRKTNASGATGMSATIQNLTSGASIKISDITPTLGDDSAVLDGGAYVYQAPSTKYAIYDYTIDDDANGSITVTVGGEEVTEAAEGKTVTITATPDAGYMLDTILVDGEAIAGTTFTMPAKAVTVEGTFKEDPTLYTVSLGANSGTGTGTVTLNGGTDPVSATYASQTSVTIVATPAEGHELEGIYVDGGLVTNESTHMLLIKQKDHVVTAKFKNPTAKDQLPDNGGALDAGDYALNEGNVNLAAGVTISGAVTIDLKGYTLSGAAAPYFTINAGGKLTIMDSVGGGKVQGLAASASATSAMILVNGGEFVLDGGLLTGHTNTSTSVYGGAIHMNATGSVFTMTGGEISGNTAERAGAIGTVQNASTHTINIHGGTIGNNTARDRGSQIYTYTTTTSRSKLNITGGTIKTGTVGHATAVEHLWLRDADVTISGNPVVEYMELAKGGVSAAAGTGTIGNLTAGASVTSKSELTMSDDTVVETKVSSTEYTYTYNYQPHAITVNSNDVAMGTADANVAEAIYGTEVTIVPKPVSGYSVKNITAEAENGEPVTVTNGTFIMPDCEVTVTVEFAALNETESIVNLTEPTEGGEVTVNVTTGTILPAGTSVIVTVDRATGYEIVVNVDGQDVELTDGRYTFDTERATVHTIVARAEKIDYELTLVHGEGNAEGGTATLSKTTANYGDEITVTAAEDYELVSVVVNDGAVTVTDGKFTMPAEDVTVTVVTAVHELPGYDGLNSVTAGVLPEGKYTLTEDVVLTGKVKIEEKVVIDLAGNKISMVDGTSTCFFEIAAGGRLTITDSVGGGMVQFKEMADSGGISVRGAFTLEGGELTGWSRVENGTVKAGGFIDMFSNTTFRMTGGTITNIAAAGQTVIRCHEAATGGHTVEITGGTITGNSAVSGDIIRMEGAVNNRATLIIGGDAVINGNIFNGAAYTYANYEIQGTNTDIIIKDAPTIGVIAPGAGSTVTISGAPKIDALRAALNSDGTLKEAASITLGELTEGAMIITGGGLDLSKITTIPEGVAAAYWNNQDVLGTQYQGYLYVPAFVAEYNQPVSDIELPELLAWADESAVFDTVGESVCEVTINGTTAELTVTVEPQVIDLTQVEVDPYRYTGEQIKPELTLEDKYGNEIPAEELVASYGDNVAVGVGTIAYTNANEPGNYVFEGEVGFEIVKGVTDLGYPTNEMMVAVKPTASADNKVQLTLPNKPGTVDVIIGDVTGEADFVTDINYADGVITFDTAAKPINTEAFFTVTVETDNYETAELRLVVKVFEKVQPTNLTATYEDTLAEIELPEGWRWADPTQSVGEVGENTFKAYFSNEETTTDLTVKVEPKVIDITYKLTNDTAVITFDGTAKEPAVTVAVKDGAEIAADQYTVEYANNVNAGTATYTIKAGKNYSFADQTGTFTIAQASLSRLTATRGYSASNAATCNDMDMGSMLPADRGETTYPWTKTDAKGAIDSVSVDEDGNVTFTTKAINQNATATIVVTASTANYGDVKLTITVNLKAAVSGDGPVVGGGPASGGPDEEKPEKESYTDEHGNNVVVEKNGNKTVTSPAGVTATITTDLYGRSEASVEIPSSAVTGYAPVTLPVQGLGQASIKVPGTVEVEFPVENVTPGTIVVVTKADGTEELLMDAKESDNGMVFTLTEDCSVKVFDNSKAFNDMAGHWSANAVAFVTARNMFAGTGNGTTFSPEVKMTRAMLAQVIYNLEGAEEHSHDADFADVADDAWYSKAINWAAREGIVSGYSNGTYQPDKELTREEVVQIFYNYAKSKGYDMSHSADLSTFADGHNVSDWALAAKQWGVGAGLISGKGGNILDAKGGATRAEGAQMFMNFCQNIAQ